VGGKGQTRWVREGRTPDNFDCVYRRLRRRYKRHPLESFTDVRDPFETLVSGILSSRTRDETTNQVMRRLFPRYGTPKKMLRLSEEELARLIYPVGFYRQKARFLREACRMLVEEFGGKVPETREELMRIPGVGRKVANLILSVVFGQDVICVDTHVHRISQRLGWQVAKTPEETEQNLMRILPRRSWRYINLILVNHGQRVCHPVGPECSRCPIADCCPRVGVENPR